MKRGELVFLCEKSMHAGLSRRLRARRSIAVPVCVPTGVEAAVFADAWRRTPAGKRVSIVVNLCVLASIVSANLQALFARNGTAYLDAPVTGTAKDAARGALTVIASGRKAVFERARSELEAIGKRVFYVGGRPGSAQVMHQINGSLFSTLLAVACEVYVTGAKAGLAPRTMAQVFGSGSGKNAASASIIPQEVFSRRFRHGKHIAEARRELDLLSEEADRQGVTMWVGGKTRQLYGLASRLGKPGDDLTRLITHYEKWAGVEVGTGSKRRFRSGA